MLDVNDKVGKIYSYAVVIRATLPEIDNLIHYLNSVDVKVAHKEISTDKLWIKREVYHEQG